MPKGKSWWNQFMLISNSCEAIMMNWQLPWIDQRVMISRYAPWIDLLHKSLIYIDCRYIPRCGMRIVPYTKSYWYEWYLPAQVGRGTVIPQLFTTKNLQAWQKIVVINKVWRTVEGPFNLIYIQREAFLNSSLLIPNSSLKKCPFGHFLRQLKLTCI